MGIKGSIWAKGWAGYIPIGGNLLRGIPPVGGTQGRDPHTDIGQADSIGDGGSKPKKRSQTALDGLKAHVAAA